MWSLYPFALCSAVWNSQTKGKCFDSSFASQQTLRIRSSRILHLHNERLCGLILLLVFYNSF